MADVALIYDEVYLKHETGSHPENKERVRQAYRYLESTPLFGRLILLKPRPASEEEILSVHSRRYYDHLRSLPAARTVALDPDTIFGPGTLEAATSAAGAITLAVDGIRDNAFGSAFCLIRPPGHHAFPDRATGFCVFSNIAIGAAYAVRQCGYARAAIIDFDVHHGNGTQAIFYDDPAVLYCSIHQWPFYPGTGARDDDGAGEGKGKTVNVPLPQGSGEDAYMEALAGTIVPAILEHKPSIVFVSAGFDAHASDSIGGMSLGTDSFRHMTETLKQVALSTCGGRLVSALEGGYNLDALAASIHAHIGALLD